MSIIDFIIGLTLVNSMPHFIIAISGRRLLSGMGTSSGANLAYSLLNASIAGGLFAYEYGWAGLADQGMFVGGLFVVVSYLLIGKPLFARFNPNAAR